MSIEYRDNLGKRIAEKTTPTISFQILDEDGNGFLPETLTLDLYDIDSGTAINGREESGANHDVLNQNGVTVDSSGNVVWSLETVDTKVLSTGRLERREAMFHWTWSGGVKDGKYLISFEIENLTKAE